MGQNEGENTEKQTQEKESEKQHSFSGFRLCKNNILLACGDNNLVDGVLIVALWQITFEVVLYFGGPIECSRWFCPSSFSIASAVHLLRNTTLRLFDLESDSSRLSTDHISMLPVVDSSLYHLLIIIAVGMTTVEVILLFATIKQNSVRFVRNMVAETTTNA